jgi:hypothetical protein
MKTSVDYPITVHEVFVKLTYLSQKGRKEGTEKEERRTVRNRRRRDIERTDT